MTSIDTQSATQATEALIHDYGRLVFRVIYGLTGDWHESEDLTQDTFVQAFKAYQAARRRIVAYSPGGEERVVAGSVDVSDMAVQKRHHVGAVWQNNAAIRVEVVSQLQALHPIAVVFRGT